jgi:hypothetical protein
MVADATSTAELEQDQACAYTVIKFAGLFTPKSPNIVQTSHPLHIKSTENILYIE